MQPLGRNTIAKENALKEIMGGYRTIWHTLEMEGIKVPRIVVQEIVKELYPNGTELRKSHC